MAEDKVKPVPVPLDDVLALVAEQIARKSAEYNALDDELKALKEQYKVQAKAAGLYDALCAFDGGTIQIVKSERVGYDTKMLEEMVPEETLGKCRTRTPVESVRAKLCKVKMPKG